MISRRSSGSSLTDKAVEPTRSSEHHSELTTFSGVFDPRLDHRGGMRHDRGITSKVADRAEQLTAIAKQDPQLLQVVICQLGKHREINTVLCETLRILGHA